MKPILIASFLAAIACAPASTSGQSPSPAVSGTAAQPFSSVQRMQAAPASHLTPEEQSTLRTASENAQKDPAVRAAVEKLHAAMTAARPAMLAKDPSLAPLLNKVEAISFPSPGAERPSLTADEMLKLRAGRSAINGTPLADAWRKATADYRAAVRQAMIAGDPSVAAILDKLSNAGGERRSIVATGSPKASASASPQ